MMAKPDAGNSEAMKLLKRTMSDTQAEQKILDIQARLDTLDTQDTQDIKNTKRHYRINLKLNDKFREYLTLASWESRKSITEYINDLIQNDINKRGIDIDSLQNNQHR